MAPQFFFSLFGFFFFCLLQMIFGNTLRLAEDNSCYVISSFKTVNDAYVNVT